MDKTHPSLEAAEGLVIAAVDGMITKSQYLAGKKRLLEMDGSAPCREALTAFFRRREGDPLNPFGGFAFAPENGDVWVRQTDAGRRIDPVALAAMVKNRSHIMNFETGSGAFRRYYYRGGVLRPCTDDRLFERLQNEVFLRDETLYKGAAVKEAASIIAHATPVGPLSKLNADETIVNFKNCVLHLDTMETEPHSPDFYSTVQLDADWTDAPQPTPVFAAFLKRLCGGDKEKMRLLMQFMGLALTNVPGWKTKKALFMVGPGNTGKSVLRSFMEALLGPENHVNVDLATLEEDKFAAAQLEGKRLAGASDLSFIRVRELAAFKQLTGGDSVYAQRKGKDPFSFRYNGLLWFCMNEPPRFGGDKGDWVYDRILLFPCGDPVPAAEQDPDLLQKLLAEKDGVVRRLILAAKEVVDAGCRFAVPDSLKEANMRYRHENDPAETFFLTCCRLRKTPEIGPLDECTCKNVFEVFRLWCRDNAPGYPPKKSEFRAAAARLLAVPEETIVIRRKNTTYFIFELTQEVREEYGDGLFIKRSPGCFI